METIWFVICGSIIVSASMKEKPTHLLRTLATAGKIREYQLEDRASFARSLPFYGQCKYGNDESDYIGKDKSSDPIDCQQKCKNTNGCTAYAFMDPDYFSTKSNCQKYRGGPYTKGDGWDGYGCYPMPDCIRYGDATCGNNGNCGDIGGGAFACTCTNGYTGDACATPPRVCTAGDAPTCQNGGSCGENSGAAVCNCVRGYMGSMCATAPTDCTWTEDATCGTNGNCGDTGGGAFACTCTNGYTGDACATPPGDCTWTGAWTGFYATCGHNGNCGDTGGGAFACTCTNGYTGDACATPPGDCTWTGDATCGTNGNCGDTGGGAFACTCTSGYSGDACATLPGDWIQKKNSDCDHDVKDPYNQLLSSYSTLSEAQTACSSDGSCIAVVDYKCDGLPFWICTTSGNRNKDGVQDSSQGSCTWIIDEGDCKTINVNTGCVSSPTTVTVNGISSYDCPAEVNKSNWLLGVDYDDKFEITINGDSVTATRTDGGGSGWCIDLSFKCCNAPDCFDGIKNQDEIGVDCGGPCSKCGYGIIWSEETPNTYCKNSIWDESIAREQLPCKKLCEADSGCVGFAWSHSVLSGCYICQDDILSHSDNDYGFYRKPPAYNTLEKKHCSGRKRDAGKYAKYGSYHSVDDAKAACSVDSNCQSVMDLSCISKYLYLCPIGSTYSSSSPPHASCIYEKEVIRQFYVDDGCQANGGDVPGTFQQESSQFGVRCCSLDGSSCVTPGSCPGSSTYEEAQYQCASLGDRLCTKTELLSEVCCATGGQCDDHRVWTSTQEPVDCVWGEYKDWTDCSQTCGGGTRTRTRREAPAASNGGASCQGSTTESEVCNPDLCPVEACGNTDNGATDGDRFGCTDYEKMPADCGMYDDDDFFSNQMCCACGGGTSGCANKDRYCELWEKRYNVCTIDADRMKERCAKTCGFCNEVSVKSAYMAVRGNYACVNSGASCGTEELCTEHSETSSNAIQVTVTCCDDASTGSRPGCVSGVDFKTAQTHCENLGLRLCTAGEIKAGSGEATGCGFDVKLTWTSNSCLLEE